MQSLQIFSKIYAENCRIQNQNFLQARAGAAQKSTCSATLFLTFYTDIMCFFILLGTTSTAPLKPTSCALKLPALHMSGDSG
jgi:hypothetical protein